MNNLNEIITEKSDFLKSFLASKEHRFTHQSFPCEDNQVRWCSYKKYYDRKNECQLNYHISIIVIPGIYIIGSEVKAGIDIELRHSIHSHQWKLSVHLHESELDGFDFCVDKLLNLWDCL